jgi:hypothetical protein
VEALGDGDTRAVTLDEKCNEKMDRTQVEVAWILGVQVSRDKRDEGKGDMTLRRVEDRCAVVKGRREVRYVIGE